MSTKRTFLVSVRLFRDNYFAATALMPKVDRDQSWVINRACELGLRVLGKDPRHPVPDEAIDKSISKVQADHIVRLERRLSELEGGKTARYRPVDAKAESGT